MCLGEVFSMFVCVKLIVSLICIFIFFNNFGGNSSHYACRYIFYPFLFSFRNFNYLLYFVTLVVLQLTDFLFIFSPSCNLYNILISVN